MPFETTAVGSVRRDVSRTPADSAPPKERRKPATPPTGFGRKLSSISLSTMATAEKAKSTKRFQAIDYELDKFTGLTTFHGLVRLYNTSWKFKIFWLVVIVASVSVFLMQVTTLFHILNAQPTVSEVRFNFTQNGLTFPVVTVCNYNPVFNTSVQKLNASGNYDLSYDVLEYIMMSYLQVENLYDEYNDTMLASLNAAYTEYQSRHPNFDILSFFKNMSQPCSQMFKLCSFGGKQFDCCKYAKPVMTDIGQCFQFESFVDDPLKSKQYISGVFYGLQMIVNVNRSEYTEVYMNNFLELGIRFFVHSHGVLPYLSTGGLSLSPGHRLYAGITPAHYQLLPKDEWGTCKHEYEQTELELLGLDQDDAGKATEVYTASNCEAHCISSQFMIKCGCVPIRYKTHDTKNPVCTPNQLFVCMDNKKMDEDEEYWYKLCPNCLVECDRWEYQIQTSYADFPNEAAVRYLEKRFHYTEPEIRRNMAVLDLFLKEISFTEYEQLQATSWTETLSDIGGNMGLFLGMSAITIAEVAVFLTKCSWAWSSTKRRDKVSIKRRASVPSNMDVIPAPVELRSPSLSPSFSSSDDGLSSTPRRKKGRSTSAARGQVKFSIDDEPV